MKNKAIKTLFTRTNWTQKIRFQSVLTAINTYRIETIGQNNIISQKKRKKKKKVHFVGTAVLSCSVVEITHKRVQFDPYNQYNPYWVVQRQCRIMRCIRI